jgi:hypothetical protein
MLNSLYRETGLFTFWKQKDTICRWKWNSSVLWFRARRKERCLFTCSAAL